jgi:hypothetical protein
MKRLLTGIVVAVALLAAERAARPAFTEVAKDRGLLFSHSYGDHHLDNIVEGTGAGACTFDFNNDGWMDVYFVTGTWTRNVSDNEGRDLRGKLTNRLFRNKGGGEFADVTEQAKVGGTGIYATGCSAADFDNDGFVDLYVLNYGPNTLYRNNGDGTFTDISKGSGLDDARWSVSAVWFDFDSDGRLDVFVGNYLKYDDGRFRDFYPAQGYPGPLSYSGEPDALYRNNGDGTFTDVSKQAGVVMPDGRAMSVSAADFNNDGLMDIFVANDAMENHYFENTGKGSFAEKALNVNLAFGEHGQGVSSMGPSIGDVNRDGLLDIYVPDLRYCSLFINGKGRFRNMTDGSGISVMMGQYAGWGSVLFDYDNDGWLDIFTVHGNAHHEYVQEHTLARNRGDGRFEDVSRASGEYFQTKSVGRGLTWGDYDNDGDVDLVLVNLNDRAHYLRNDGGNSRRWLSVEPRLKFATGSRLAIGARVTVSGGDLRQVDDVNPVRGYLSQGDPRLFFGLGDAAQATVEIRWPDGVVQRLADVAAGQHLRVEHEAQVRQ